MEIKNGININKKLNIPLKIKTYKIEKALYTISNSYLYLATNLNIKEKVLIKIYDKEIINNNPEEISLINNEIFMMKLINHKNILKLYEIIESPSFIYLILECFNTTKLIDYIKTKKKLSEDESLNIYKQIISLLLYFNEMNIGHLNLNPNDILIDNNNNIKLCDFKYSVFYTNNTKLKCKLLGDASYLSPELLSEKSCYPELADIWSSGVLLYLCLNGQLPFKGINNYDLQKKIMEAEFALPLNLSKNLQEFFKYIFEVKTEERYNLEKILNSSLFKEKKINKNNLSKGFNILSIKYPIDERVLNICKTHFGMETEDLKQKLLKNIFDHQTSLYKQIIAKFIKKKISTEIDLTTKKFYNYIDNKKNILDDITQKNNIQENLKKIEETEKSNKELITKIEEKENMALIKLEELIKKYKNNEEETEPEKQEEKDKEDKIIENKKEDSENISYNKINKTNNSSSKNYKKRGSVNIIPDKIKIEKLNTIQYQKYYKRRMTSAADTKEQIKQALEKLNYVNATNFDLKNNQDQKNITQESVIIKALKEEKIKKEEQKEISSNKSITNSRKSSISKTPSNIIESNAKKNETNIEINKEKNYKNKTITKTLTIKPNKSKIQTQKTKNINIIKKAPSSQITKENIFKQIKNVKLKKYTTNTYVNPDQIKRKPREENNNSTSVEYSAVSVKNVIQMVEKKIKFFENNKTNLSAQPRKKGNIIKKTLTFKNNRSTINKRYRRRKTKNNNELYMFNNKGIMINKNEIKKEKSKDDSSRFKFNNNNNNNEIIEENVSEFVLPKDYKTEKMIREEKRKKYEEKRRRDEKEKRKRKEKEEKAKKDLEEKRKKEIEEKIKEQNEIEEREKKVKEEKERIKLEERKRREIESRQKKEQEELRLRLLEEARIRKELEDEERRIKEQEEEEERQRIAEEEEKKRREEERVRKIKEREEEDKRREEEERLRKEKEKERIRLEEEEKIRKWKEELKLQKELEDKKKKEEEEKKRIEEEERIRKRKEESEKKRREMQEENRRKFEEYQRMIKDEEDKRLIKEKMKREKEEEIRKKREKEIQEIRNGERKKISTKLEFGSENSESSIEDEKQLSNKENISKKQFENNQLNQINKNIKYNINTDLFSTYYDQYSEELTSPKNNQIKEIQKSKVIVQNIKKRKSGPKLFEFHKFIESDKSSSDRESYEETKIITKNNKNENEKNNSKYEKNKNNGINNKAKNILYNQFTDYFLANNIYNKKENNKENIIKENKQKNEDCKRKLLYHYQQNQGQSENKSIYEMSFQNRNKNVSNISLEKRINSSYTNKNNNNNNNLNEIKLNQKKNILPSYNIRTIKMRKPKNYFINAEKENEYDTETPKILNNLRDENNILKKSKQKNNIKTKTEKVRIKKLAKNLDKSNYITNLKSSTINNINKLNFYSHQKTNQTLNYETFDYNDYDSSSLILNSSILSKNRNININTFNIITDYDMNDSNKSNKIVKKIKNNSKKKKINLKEEELPLYKGEINYYNVSAKNIEDSINDLMNRYKLKGYTCIKKDKSKYKFVKGPNIHNVELMRLGNGLLYFNINKL